MNQSISIGLKKNPVEDQRPAKPDGLVAPHASRRWICFGDLHREPFRVFFPAATLAGLIGVALWPVVLLGWAQNYPGPSHARLMVQGFFGGFIFGFMGTAMPRLIGACPFSARETFSLLALFLGNVSANTMGLNTLADWLFVGEVVLLFNRLKGRCHSGGDLPPPTFVLVGLGFASALAGTTLNLAGRRWELSPPLELLARLLSFHGFVLLAVMGAGGFILPKFLGLKARRTFPEGPTETPEWKHSVQIAKAVGFLILLTYVLEAFNWGRVAGIARAALLVGYLIYLMPVERLRWNWRGVQWQLVVGLVCVPLGVLASGWFPVLRVTLSHLELLGGFGLITFAVATRVVFGHSGAREKLERFNPWLVGAVFLMVLGLACRITGDFLPGIQTTHYLYGAGCWMLGAMMWAGTVLWRVVRPDTD